MEHVLVADGENYRGQYVATSDWGSNEVLCACEEPLDAYNEALALGCEQPVITYIPIDDDLPHL